MAEDGETASAPTGDEAGTGGRPARRGRARTILVLVAVAALVLLGIWLINYETHGKYIESTNDAYLRADSVVVSPKVSGYVDQVFVGDNQDVKSGQPLVRIDPRDYRAQTAQYQALIDVSAANVENIRAGIREQQAQIDGARAQLTAAIDQANFAANEVARYTPLAASGAETRERLTTLRNQSAQAAGQAAAQRAALASAIRAASTSAIAPSA